MGARAAVGQVDPGLKTGPCVSRKNEDSVLSSPRQERLTDLA